MADYIFDSSSIVKHYVVEAGSAWVRSLLDPQSGHSALASILSAVEVTAALARRLRAGTLSPSAGQAALIRIQQDVGVSFFRVALTDSVVADAITLARRHALRGYDAVQLATALQVRQSMPRVILVSSDLELNAAALAEGLTVDDPNTHP